jgi:hypothetical protein
MTHAFKPPSQRTPPPDLSKPPRLLDALTTECIPRLRKRGPLWKPAVPPTTWDVRVPRSWPWSRPYDGPVTVLDLSGAWVSAISSVTVGLGALTHTGDDPYAKLPGHYLVRCDHPWTELDMPHPLGRVREGMTTMWVDNRAVSTLRELVLQGRWPEADVLDSYTCSDRVRLSEWAAYINGLREYAITTFGRESDEYGRVKDTMSMAVMMMLGRVPGDESAGPREWIIGVRRPDWAQAIMAQAAYTLWQWCDDARRVAPEYAPVRLHQVDELHVPTEAVPILEAKDRPALSGGKPRGPLVLDQAGIKLGTFKAKRASVAA